MKNTILTTTVLMLSIFAVKVKAQNSLTIQISNIETKKGTLEVALFNKKEGFLKSGSQYKKMRVKVTGNAQNITFENLPKGNYAVALYHDENSDNKCNTNFIGIPTEGYGFSNNVKPKLSAPSFDATKIAIDQQKTIKINLIN